MAYQSINPVNNEFLGEFPKITDAALDSKLTLAEKSFETWSALKIDKRVEYINRLKKILTVHTEEFAGLMAIEMGKPITQAIAEVEKCALLCQYYAENGEMFLHDQEINSSMPKSIISYEPIGVVFAVMPWNFPFWQVFRFLIPNLILGNTGLLKHASNVPQCAKAIEQACLDAEIPKGVFQNLFIDYSQSEKVIAHKAVQGVTLTGSEKAGARVASLAGENIKKTVLELGGSDPFIVFEDAGFDKAVKTGVAARMQNNGQSCIASKRFLVHESIFEEYLYKYVSIVESLKIGNPLEKETEIGPLARPYLVEELDRQVSLSVKAGAKLVTGGERFQANYYKPTVVTHINKGMRLFSEETFGPVACFFSFKDEKEAISLANSTEFGLGASVWTTNPDRINRVAKSIRSGTVAINGMVKSDSAVPFGGIKKSGFGRELSEAGLKEFANIKTINIY